MRTKKMRGLLCLGMLGLFLLINTERLFAAQEFSGITVNIVTTKTIIAEPLKRRAPDFEQLTGATINVVEVDFSTLYDTIKNDFASDNDDDFLN